MKTILIFSLLVGALVSCSTKPVVNTVSGFDAELTQYKYPYDVQYFELESQNQKMRMAFMDLKAKSEAAPVIVLLHGKNFGSYAFSDVAKRLSEMGYRVFMPDQIGFGKSTKPKNFQYTFQSLASMTNHLLESQGIKSYILLGHSMGGMLATRMALMYPDKISKLILVNPIGLEDWKLLAPYKTVDAIYKDELRSTPETIRKYQSDAYYSGGWKPEYDKLIEAASGWTKHPDFPLIAWNSALTTDMVFTQPVVYEFKNIKMPTALIIGQKDLTAVGKAWAPEENKKKMGLYPELGRKAVAAIPKAKLYAIKDVGHVPFIENIDQFFKDALNPALAQ